MTRSAYVSEGQQPETCDAVTAWLRDGLSADALSPYYVEPAYQTAWLLGKAEMALCNANREINRLRARVAELEAEQPMNEVRR